MIMSVDPLICCIISLNCIIMYAFDIIDVENRNYQLLIFVYPMIMFLFYL